MMNELDRSQSLNSGGWSWLVTTTSVCLLRLPSLLNTSPCPTPQEIGRCFRRNSLSVASASPPRIPPCAKLSRIRSSSVIICAASCSRIFLIFLCPSYVGIFLLLAVERIHLLLNVLQLRRAGHSVRIGLPQSGSPVRMLVHLTVSRPCWDGRRSEAERGLPQDLWRDTNESCVGSLFY